MLIRSDITQSESLSLFCKERIDFLHVFAAKFLHVIFRILLNVFAETVLDFFSVLR